MNTAIATIMAVFAKYAPFVMAFAEGEGDGATSFMSNLVTWGAGIGGGIVALFLIISLVKDGIEFAKGQGSSSIFKIVGKALFLILIIGLIFLAVNYTTLGKKAETLGNGVINAAENEANVILK